MTEVRRSSAEFLLHVRALLLEVITGPFEHVQKKTWHADYQGLPNTVLKKLFKFFPLTCNKTK